MAAENGALSKPVRHEFELDPGIIHHIIHSQAGSIGKALIELVMNSGDAGAQTVQVHVDRSGFTCQDNGKGFSSQEEIRRFFGRFGTPHIEGDATWGRFRVGRGQVMGYASTKWRSGRWCMDVDTLNAGHGYDLYESEVVEHGCLIEGQWYERLSDQEVQECVQEIRELVRYTPMTVMLNGVRISKLPHTERWDYEDELAYYRVKAEGAVGIYNQGVLVRNDPGHHWGVGGTIVTKKAIALNVSRTEILRKSCGVWRQIEAAFRKLVKEKSQGLAEGRQSEERREQAARSLLTGRFDIESTVLEERTITLLPGKRHITLDEFIGIEWETCVAVRSIGLPVSVVEDIKDIYQAEVMAREGKIRFVHPSTIWRFGCHDAEEFQRQMRDVLERVKIEYGDVYDQECSLRTLPEFMSFKQLKAKFSQRTRIVDERTELTTEERRVWNALRASLKDYASYSVAQPFSNASILVGEANWADAWTDGETYIAIGIPFVRALRTDPLGGAGEIFSLFDHELCHSNENSLDCGHDEAFYHRFHEQVLQGGRLRQRLIHEFVMRYTRSLERSIGAAQGKKAWRERFLIDKTSNAREGLGLPRIDVNTSDASSAQDSVVDFDADRALAAQASLQAAGYCPGGKSPNTPEH